MYEYEQKKLDITLVSFGIFIIMIVWISIVYYSGQKCKLPIMKKQQWRGSIYSFHQRVSAHDIGEPECVKSFYRLK